MSHVLNALQRIGRLLNYPGPETPQLARQLEAQLVGTLSDAAPSAARFREFVEQSAVWEIEEVYTRTFDINPACALEVGWHLFGEEYVRGLFMVRMREELRRYDLPESVELPDHIVHVLSVVAAMPADEATRFVCACVSPAVRKMHLALKDKETPYRHIIDCLESVLGVEWGVVHETGSQESPVGQKNNDLLRAFPVSEDDAVDCGTCSRLSSNAVPGDLVPRESEFRGLVGNRDRVADSEEPTDSTSVR